ncbi:MAG: DinB family protein [Planctomycetota bacterium]
MNLEALAARMERFPAALSALVSGLPANDALWRPDERTWSITEIVAHLVDEELEDFRARVLSTLADPSTPWSPWDPEGTATHRSYRERDLESELARFAVARADSLEQLRAAASGADWELAYQHPTHGPLRVGDLMTSWAAHDALHLRQISKRLFELASRDGGYGSDYAGSW